MKTVANILHLGHFTPRTHEGPTAYTQIPDLERTREGVISLPRIDGKKITEEIHLALRAHEYGHIIIDERGLIPLKFMEDFKVAGASDTLIQVCMDVAVNAYIRARCRYLPLGMVNYNKKKLEETLKILTPDEKMENCLQHMSVLIPGFHGPDAMNAKDVKHRAKLTKVIREMKSDIYSLHNGGEVLYSMEKLVNYCFHNLSESPLSFNYSTFWNLCKELLREVKVFKDYANRQKEFDEKVQKDYKFNETDMMNWGIMSVVEGKLNNDMRRNWKQRHVPKFMGSLRYMHRCMTDMKVWGLKDRSIPPLAVLIDCSGSMSVEDKHIRSILEKQPASVVAGYSGNEEQGNLYILGKDGKYADEEEISSLRDNAGYGNVVDGPALVWLSEQKGRLIWISDGMVTGSGESQSRDNYLFCQQMIEKYNIEMYGSINAFEKNELGSLVIPHRFRK